MDDVLDGKRVLIVDDEPDVLETLRELLDTCIIDSAPDFDTAKKFLKHQSYDAAILDIMGVSGYEILELSSERGIPTIMLTAHALSPDHLVKSLKEGAQCYLPKDKMADISDFLAEVLQASEKGARKSQNWFDRINPYFDKKFGSDWKDKHSRFLKDIDLIPTREEMEKIL